MSLTRIIDFVLYLHNFKNIDLSRSGSYYLQCFLYQEISNNVTYLLTFS